MNRESTNMPLGNSNGFSLIEVLIAVVLMGVVSTAIFKTYINQHESYLAQEDISTIQQSARASIDELTRQIRMAGNGIPTGMDPLVAADSDPDTITILYRKGDCDTWLDSTMPQPSSELKCGSDVSCFEEGEWVYIFEPDSGLGEWFEITHVQTGSNHLQHNTMSLSRKYGKDAIVLALNSVKFYIDKTSDPDSPKLMVKLMGQAPLLYADNITDLQFRYRMTDASLSDEPVLMTDVREVLISITGRSSRPDPDDTSNGGYRTRTYSSSASLRNMM